MNRHYVAQYREPAGEWVSIVNHGDDSKGYDVGWKLADEMQRHGMRYGELGGERGLVSDMIKGEVLTAEDGTEFQVIPVSPPL